MVSFKFLFNVKDIADILGFQSCKDARNYSISSVSPSHSPCSNSLIFINKWNDGINLKLSEIKESLIIIPLESDIAPSITLNNLVLPAANPRKEYAVILTHILNMNKKKVQYKFLDDGTILGPNIVIGKGTYIEPGVFIDDNVSIGDNCTILTGVKIRSNVSIGNSTVIRENSVIGGQGFGIEKGDNHSTIRIPHIGGLKIGSNVDIGAFNTIHSGTIEPTVIEDHVKTDDHILIAHNCRIGKGTLIVGCSIICGSVEVGSNVWIGPNTSIINKTNISDDSWIGIGAVVLSKVKNGRKVLGNPAREI